MKDKSKNPRQILIKHFHGGSSDKEAFEDDFQRKTKLDISAIKKRESRVCVLMGRREFSARELERKIR